MALGFGKGKEEDVVSLIAAKKYARAIEVLKAQLQKKGANPSLRMQLADVLILADKKNEAVGLLIPLADQFAREGFAAKAVSVLKKIQKVDPGRRDVEERLARQIEEKQREATGLPLSRQGGSAPLGGFEEGPSLEIGMEPMAPVSASVPLSEPEPAPVPQPPPAPPALELPPAVAAAPPDATIRAGGQAPEPLVFVEPLPTLELAEEPSSTRAAPPPPAEPPPAAVEFVLAEEAPALPLAPSPAPTVPAVPAVKPVEEEIEDYDLLYFAEGEGDEQEVPVEAEIVEGEATAAPMSAGQFADELMGLVDSVFQEFQSAPSAPGPAAVAAAGEPHGGNQIVVSPLFRDFSVDEMVAVIQGLKLLSLERGAVILREGQGGGSLYMLTSGRVRAFKKDAQGKQTQLGDLTEGAFFGEMSILTGQPRMASVVALARCELLELDRPTLDGITKTHPHVWDVLREFAEKRRVAAPR
jgi:Cyclic nucleotide-binding domain/Tetratricopeptide repeat